MLIQHGDIIFDYTHEKLDVKTLDSLVQFAEDVKLKEKISGLFDGVCFLSNLETHKLYRK
jgi:glucose-6-phosphate isomerase